MVSCKPVLSERVLYAGVAMNFVYEICLSRYLLHADVMEDVIILHVNAINFEQAVVKAKEFILYKNSTGKYRHAIFGIKQHLTLDAIYE